MKEGLPENQMSVSAVGWYDTLNNRQLRRDLVIGSEASKVIPGEIVLRILDEVNLKQRRHWSATNSRPGSNPVFSVALQQEAGSVAQGVTDITNAPGNTAGGTPNSLFGIPDGMALHVPPIQVPRLVPQVPDQNLLPKVETPKVCVDIDLVQPGLQC